MPNIVLEKQFKEAYHSHSDAIFRFILFKIDNREKALDFTQETFMKTWVHITKNGAPQNIRAFLYRVAGNMIIDEYRRRGKKEYITDSLEDMSETGYEPSVETSELESAINRLDGATVMGFVKELPDMYSSILLMKYSDEMSISEISESLSVSQNVVSVRINRALKKLKDIVDSNQNIEK